MLNGFRKYNYFSDETKYKNNYDYNLALLIMNNKFYMTNESVILVENENPFSAVSELHYEHYIDINHVKEKLQISENIQCIVGENFVPFGNSQTPSLFDYADGVDVMQFLLSL